MRALWSRFGLILLVVGALSISAPDPADAQASKPRVLFHTNQGDFTVELEPERAPKTVANFLQYVREGHYDGTIFHRVVAGFVVQGGGFTADYRKLPTHGPIQNEADKGLSNERGTIAMARTSDPHSASDQFFINLKFNGSLDYRAKTTDGWGYTAFGRVVDGMNIVARIGNVPTGKGGPFDAEVPQQPVIIEKASIIAE